ncbi:MAG: DUF1501 domain-containing protein [Solirubrobacteraceae bacterium]|nr:DUF1501 domain-containing protein [Solirubrobacteraceae bacterium]
MAHRHCQNFKRTELLRTAAAEAGRGLPSIEPGMPLPAGTGMDRRKFLLRTAGLGLSVYAAGQMAGFDVLEAGVAQAAEGGPAPIIISVFLEGGIDGLSVLAPVGDPLYRAKRPRLALPESEMRFGEDNRLVWHPSAAPLAALHGEGKLTVMPAIGYTDADQSHFTSRHFWEVGATDAGERTGWLGRWLDHVGTGDNPVQGLSLDGRLSPVLASARVPVAAIGGAGDYALGARGVGGELLPRMQASVARIGAAHSGSADPALRAAAGAGASVMRMSEQMAPFKVDPKNPPAPPVAYPNNASAGFPLQMAGLAWLIAGGLPTRAVAVRAAGEYDTHEGQPADLTEDLQLVSETLLAFQRDLEARGLADRVLTLVWSEFGRRVEENASMGTDHGAAGVGFVMGTRASGRMVGEFPGLAKLDPAGNLRATSDYRAVYSSLLEQWLGTDAAAIIPGAATLGRPRMVK